MAAAADDPYMLASGGFGGDGAGHTHAAAPSAAPMEQTDLDFILAEAAEVDQAAEDVLEVADEADDGALWEENVVGEPIDHQRSAVDYSDVAELAPAPAEDDPTALAEDAVSSNGDADEEPPWLADLEISNDGGTAAMDAEVTGGYLDELADQDEDMDAAYPQYVPRLAQYLIGHPDALITKRRKRPGKGCGKRYYAEEKTTDVMADKTVTGCWACGKLDHESHECEFKRCFICSEQGHEHGDCGMKQERCVRCKSQGHIEEFCPMQAYGSGLEDAVDVAFCSCMLCREEGHLNCGEVPASSSGAPGKGPVAPAHPPWGQKAIGAGDYGKASKGGWQPQGGRPAGPYDKGCAPYGKGKACGGCWPGQTGAAGLLRPRAPIGARPSSASPPWGQQRPTWRPRPPSGAPPGRAPEAEDEDAEEDERWAKLAAGNGDGHDLDANEDDGGCGAGGGSGKSWGRPTAWAGAGAGKPTNGNIGKGAKGGPPPSWRPSWSGGGGGKSWGGGGGGCSGGARAPWAGGGGREWR